MTLEIVKRDIGPPPLEAGDDAPLQEFLHGPTNLPGNATRSELVERYREQTGAETRDVLFYYCFGLFRLAVIVQQIYYRYAMRHTRDARFSALDSVVANLGDAAVAAIDRGRLA